MSPDLLLLKLLNLKLAHPVLDPLMEGVSELKHWWPVFIGSTSLLLWRKGKGDSLIVGLTIMSNELSKFLSYDVGKPLFRRERPCHVVP